MAIYHLHASCVSRGKGSSTVATASYITGTRLKDERTGNIYDYGRKQRIVNYGVVLADSMPADWATPERLTNEIEKAARQNNATVGRKLEIALPVECTQEKQQDLVLSFIRDEITPYGYGCIWAIHTDTNGHNPHAHILVADQPYADGRWQPKSRTAYALDKHGERIPVIDTRTGKQKVGRRNRKEWERIREDHYLKKKSTLLHIRAAWADLVNDALEQAGHDTRIDHRSYADQGNDKIPSIHEGYAARRMKAEGFHSERVEVNEKVQELNRANQAVQELKTRKRIYDRIRESIERIRRQFDSKLQDLQQRFDMFADSATEQIRTLLERSAELARRISNNLKRVSGRNRDDNPGSKNRDGETEAAMAGSVQSQWNITRSADSEVQELLHRARTEEVTEKANSGTRCHHRRLSALILESIRDYDPAERKAARSVPGDSTADILRMIQQEHDPQRTEHTSRGVSKRDESWER